MSFSKLILGTVIFILWLSDPYRMWASTPVTVKFNYLTHPGRFNFKVPKLTVKNKTLIRLRCPSTSRWSSGLPYMKISLYVVKLYCCYTGHPVDKTCFTET